MSTCRGLIRFACDAWQASFESLGVCEAGIGHKRFLGAYLLWTGALPSGEAYEVDEANQESTCESLASGHACADHFTTAM